MTAQTFIFVHDEQIVLDYIAAGKFNQLPDVKYVFLGQRPVDRIEHLIEQGKLIVARWTRDNIEHLPNLVAWTGWYAVLKNGYVTADVVNLFEYDVNVGEWVQPYSSTGYFWHAYADSVWWNYNNIREELRRMKVSVLADPLPMTSNYTLKANHLLGFVDDLMRNSLINAYHPQAGHIVERYCSAWMQYYANFGDGLKHLYADSHGTQGRGDRYDQLKSKLL